MHADAAAAASFAYIFGVDEAPHSGSFIIIIINLLSLCGARAPPFIAASVCARERARWHASDMYLSAPELQQYSPYCLNTHTIEHTTHSLALREDTALVCVFVCASREYFIAEPSAYISHQVDSRSRTHSTSSLEPLFTAPCYCTLV